jgi:hypothetical protein
MARDGTNHWLYSAHCSQEMHLQVSVYGWGGRAVLRVSDCIIDPWDVG